MTHTVACPYFHQLIEDDDAHCAVKVCILFCVQLRLSPRARNPTDNPKLKKINMVAEHISMMAV